jgi:large subunit ribosomal protein L2
MILKKKKSITPSQRHFNKIICNTITEKKPLLKVNLKKLKKKAGRNNTGRITIAHKGSGHKQRYRKLDFSRNSDATAIVLSIEYDPVRTNFISAIYNIQTKKYSYILTPKNLQIGSIVQSGPNVFEPKLGFCMLLEKIPIGSLLHNISILPKGKGCFIISAGTSALLIEKTQNSALVQLNHKRKRYLSLNCFATLGSLSNEFFFLNTKGKAGRSRWLNIRPTVRGVAMNPIDHPHGGGEGKKSGSKKSPWGKF